MFEAWGLLVFGFGGALLGLAGLMRPGILATRTFAVAIALVCLVTAGIAGWSENPVNALLPLLVVSGWFLFRAARTRETLQWAVAFLQRPTIACLILLVVTPMLTWLWSWNSSRLDPSLLPRPIARAPRLVEMPTHYVTDQGRALAIYHPTQDMPEEDQEILAMQSVSNVIPTAPAGYGCNCHGWVFTKGRYWIMAREVRMILSDNRYQKVPQPKPGDLIVYSNGSQIVHTGLVRAADEHGVLIESKWGMGRRFIHAPEHQPYAKEFAYYRSDRAGHGLLEGEWVSTESAGGAISVQYAP